VARRYPVNDIESRRLLVERVASSSYLSKSARLRGMFHYLCVRVLDESAEDIHEHEVGHRVFGRPLDYDTAADNIVRVHASTLRKRIEQYFANEGSDEPVVIDIPKGNYAPVFRERRETERPVPVSLQPAIKRQFDWRIWLLASLVIIFASATLFLWFRRPAATQSDKPAAAVEPVVRQFWSQIFRPDKPADIVLDDAAVGLFQEITGRQIPLSEYFDRSYLRSLDDRTVKEKLNRGVVEPLVLKRQSSYSGASLLWRLAQTAGLLHGDAKVQFARDYSFRQVKDDNAILLGNSRSNPWIEAFEDHLDLRWRFDGSFGRYYPVDTSSQSEQGQFQSANSSDEPREGYATVSLLPNLSGAGNVLIISATGGSTMSAAAEFLSDGKSLTQLASLLPQSKPGGFPYFETLLKINSRSSLPRDISIIICRPLRT
jgi:hypothetical protein